MAMRALFRILVAAFAVGLLLSAASCRSGGTPATTPTGVAPSATATAAASATPTPVPFQTPSPTASPIPTAAPAVTLYTVVAGDTLYSLARRFGTTVEAIMALNNLSDTTIETGQVLKIPTGSIPPPTPGPTSTPSAAASALIEQGPRTSSAVALTFDMGGRVDPAVDIVNWLIANRVAATIFMTGAMAENPNTDAGRQVLALIQAHQELFQLGNHSYSHPDFRTLTPAEMAAELSQAEAAIARYTTVSPRPLFRPPYGGVDSAVLAAAGAAGYPYTIMWDVDTADWQPPEEGGPTAAEIVAKVAANAQGGSIVIMHLGGYNTLEALPGVVAALRAAGLTPVNVSAMLP